MRSRRHIARLLKLAALAYLSWCVLLWLVQRSLLYLPGAAGAPLPDRLVDHQPIELRVGPDGGTCAWLLLPPGNPPDAPPPRLAVFFHGNAELIDHCDADAAPWLARGIAVLMTEYRGYGRSRGAPTQEGLVEDALGALAQAARLHGVGSGGIFLHGRSLGTGVAAQVAARMHPSPALIVLESPFTSTSAFAWRFGVPPFLVRDSYRTDRALADLGVPVVILSSHDDEIVPFAHAARLHGTIAGSMLVELTGSHNGALSAQPPYWEAIDRAISGLPH